MARLVYELRLSDSMRDFLAAALDLLQEVRDADEMLVTDAIRESAERLEAVIERNRGAL